MLKLQAGLLAHGSWLLSTFPDVTIQWFLETTPHLQWPHRSGLAPDSLFSPAIGRGTWSLVHIYLSDSDIMPSQGDCQYTNTMFRMLHHDDVGRTEREPAVSIHNCCVQHIQANIGAFVQRKQHLWGRLPVSRCSHRRKRTSGITGPAFPGRLSSPAPRPGPPAGTPRRRSRSLFPLV